MHTVENCGVETAIDTQECAGCGADLCDCCDQFVCVGCDETFCLEHRVVYNGEEACPMCAHFWAEESQRKLKEIFVERMEARLNFKSLRKAS